MTWVRTEDNAAHHPKFIRAGVEAYGWWHAALGYCNRYLTDGFIPTRDLIHVFPGVQGEQLEKILTALKTNRSIKLARRGIILHDYLDFQPSREQVLSRLKSKVEAGKIGGQRSWETRSSGKQPASAHASAHAQAPAEVSAEPPSRPDRPNPTHPIRPSHDAGPFAHATGSNGTPTADELAEHNARQERARQLLRSAGLTPQEPPA